jgi:NADH:ubiquinone oxidoreductase subunit F (NADH-binding)
MGYDNLRERGATLGSGAIIVMGSEKPLIPMLQNILKFFKHESCGKCVPCRLGTNYLYEQSLELKKEKGLNRNEILDNMVNHARIMAKSSLCPLGQSPILPLESLQRHFTEEIINE